MAVDNENSAPAGSEERASKEASAEEQVSRVPRWLVVTAVLALTGVAIVIVYGYLASPKPKWIGVANKNFWDWLKLLVVPAALAIGVYWLNTRQAARQQQAQAAQAQHALDVEDRRAHHAALQAYLDQMSQLLTDKDRPLRWSMRTLARARSLTVLARLDGNLKWNVLMFLQEAGLISEDGPVVSLKWANLQEAKLGEVVLEDADLSETKLQRASLCAAKLRGARLVEANLSGANLSGADLREADLRKANLSETNLSGANLSHALLGEAHLTKAILSGASLYEANLAGTDLTEAILGEAHLIRADLRESILIKADLRGANLRGALLASAVLSEANLTGADLREPTFYLLDGAEQSRASEVSYEKLAQEAFHLEGATMPNGQKYEDWRKDREGHKEGDNSGPS